MDDDKRTSLLEVPSSRRDDVREIIHGVEVADHYRWLEDGASAETRAWIAAQQAYAAPYFATPERKRIRARFSELMRVDEVGIPIERNGYYYFSRRNSDEQRAVICRRRRIDGRDDALIDPGTMSADQTIGIEICALTSDGALLAYAVRRGGEDETEIRVMEVETRRDIDTLPRGRYGGLSWKHDNSGFYYVTRIDERPSLRFHRIATPGAKDRELLSGNRDEWIDGRVSEDGHYLLIHVFLGSAADRTRIYLQVLDPEGAIKTVVDDCDARFGALFAGDALIILTNWNAPNLRVMRAGLKNPSRDSWREIISEGSLCAVSIAAAGGKLIVSYLEDAHYRLKVFDPDGTYLRDVELPGAGWAANFTGRWERTEAFFYFSSFNHAPAIYRYDLGTGARDLWWHHKGGGLDDDRFEMRQVWYASKDGTRVPMYLFHRRGLELDRARPTLLTGYGGFNAGVAPYYYPPAVLWADAGGVFVSANLRGGGEFGRKWHEAGQLEKKQNVFDDFIAAAEWLIQNGYTSPSKLAIAGGSNGGLLVAAALTQCPELFRAVLCLVPLLDMIRYHKFSIAPVWVPEYESADDPDQFRFLIKYSPYHHVQAGVRYPAVMLVTGDLDTRVDPLHARKMTAALQAVTSADRRVLLRYRSESGHMLGAAIDATIDEFADEMTFLLCELEVSSDI